MTHDEACQQDDQDDQAPARQSPQDGTAAPPRKTHLSLAGLRARGWTLRMVRQLLGEPDLLRANPYFRTAPQTRLYRVDRVEAVEASEEFRTVSAASVRRSVAAKAAAQRRRREVLARIAAEPVDVPRLPPDRLVAEALAHRNDRDEEGPHERGDHAPRPATVESAEPEALARWKVDYLRHRLTRYDELLDGLYGSTGRAAAEELLRRRVYAAISAAYPDLARECERRLREREFSPPQF